MSIFRFKPSCKHKMEVRNHIGMVIREMVCVNDKGHTGAHCDKYGNRWVTLDRHRSFVEDKARGL